jgi:hypothetical protein
MAEKWGAVDLSIILSFMVMVEKLENDLPNFMVSPSMSVSPQKMHCF